MGDWGCQLERVCLLLGAEPESVESNVSELQLLGVVDGIYLHLALAEEKKSVRFQIWIANKPEEEVIVGVGWHEDQFLQIVNNSRLDKLKEDVVASLVGLLVSNPRFLEQIDVDETSS